MHGWRMDIRESQLRMPWDAVELFQIRVLRMCWVWLQTPLGFSYPAILPEILSINLHLLLMWWLVLTKETSLGRADFTLQLFMFVTVERERYIFVELFPVFVSCFPRDFKLGQAERVQTT